MSAWPTIVIGGVDRTAWVKPDSIVIDDTRSDTPASMALTLRRLTGWRPSAGQTVTATLDGRCYFAGTVTRTKFCERKSLDGVVHEMDVSCTGAGRTLDAALYFGYFTATSASTIAAAIFAFGGISTGGVEAGLDVIDEITFDGVRPSEALTRLAAECGAQAWYIDESEVGHFWATADAGVETPDTITTSNVVSPSVQLEEDWSQVITRQAVEGRGTTLAAPAFAGDTSLALVDGYDFPATGLAAVHGARPCRVPYTAVARLLTAPGQTEPVSTPAGAVRIGVYPTTDDLPPMGWLYRPSDGEYLRYTSIAAEDMAVRLPGSISIASITNAGWDGGLGGYHIQIELASSYLQPHGFTCPATGLYVTFYGTAEATLNGSNVYCWELPAGAPDGLHIGFVFGVNLGSHGAGGYCGRTGVQPVSSMSWADDVATVYCAYGHPYAVDDWVTIAGHSVSGFNGTFPVSATTSSTFSFPLRGYHAAGTGGTHHYAGTPQAEMGAGTVLRLADSLTGCSGVVANAGGSAANLVAVITDAAAVAALAAADGSDGIREGALISDPTLSSAEAASRAQAVLTVYSPPERRLTFGSLDPKIRGGSIATVSLWETDSFASEVLADSPLAYWRLDERSGSAFAGLGSDAHDLAIAGTPALGGDGALATGDGAPVFTGADYASVAHQFIGSTDMAAAFSLEAWLLATTSGIVAFSQGNAASANTKCQLFIGVGGYTVRITDDAGTVHDFAESGYTRGDGRWHHVLFTRGAEFGGHHECKFYVDNILTAADVVAGGGTYSFTEAAVGRRAGASPGSGWIGRIQHLALYGAALSEARVAAHYAAWIRPKPITGTFRIQRVLMQDWGRGESVLPTRRVQASDQRFSVFNIWRRLQRPA